MDVMCEVNFKSEKNNDESNTQKQNKNGGGEQDKSKKTSFSQAEKHERVLLLWFRNACVK